MLGLSDTILVAIIAFFSAMIGAVVQFFLTRNFEKSKFVRDQRRGAYQKFLIALGDLSQHPRNSPDWISARAAVVDARCQIALFGSSDVVRLLVEVFENSSTFEHGDDQRRLCHAIGAMRKDSVGSDGPLDDELVYALIFASGGGKLQ